LIDCRDDGKGLLDYVIRRFNLFSARLNKPQGWIFAETPFSAIPQPQRKNETKHWINNNDSNRNKGD